MQRESTCGTTLLQEHLGLSVLLRFRSAHGFTAEREEQLKQLSKTPDIYERLSKALGNNCSRRVCVHVCICVCVHVCICVCVYVLCCICSCCLQHQASMRMGT